MSYAIRLDKNKAARRPAAVIKKYEALLAPLRPSTPSISAVPLKGP